MLHFKTLMVLSFLFFGYSSIGLAEWSSNSSSIYPTDGSKNVGIKNSSPNAFLSVGQSGAHSKEKISLWPSSKAHMIGTEAYHFTFGPGAGYGSSVGAKFYSRDGELAVQLGMGGSGSPGDRKNSNFYGDVSLSESLYVDGFAGFGNSDPNAFLSVGESSTHSKEKISLWNTSNAHMIGTEAYHITMGPGAGYEHGVGVKFYSADGELAAQIGHGGQTDTLERRDSSFFSINGIAYPDPDATTDHGNAGTEGSIAWFLEQMESTGGIIVLRPGTYTINSSLNLVSNITIQGSGANSIIQQGVDGMHLLYKSNSVDPVENVMIKNLQLIGNSSADSDCIHMNASDSDRNASVWIQGLKVKNCGGQGIHVKGTNQLVMSDLILYSNGTSTSYDHNIYLKRIDNATITNVVSRNSSGNGFSGDQLDGVSISNFVARDNGLRGIRVAGSKRVTIDSSQAIGNEGAGIVVYINEEDAGALESHYVTITGCVVYNNTTSGIRLYGSHFIVNGCVIKDNDQYGIKGSDSPDHVIVSNNIFENNLEGNMTGLGHSSNLITDNIE